MKRKLLNVRSILEGIVEIERGYVKYGACPAVGDYLKQLSFLSRTALRKRDATGTRKDFYIEAP